MGSVTNVNIAERCDVHVGADDVSQRRRVFGCPEQASDLMAKVDNELKEQQASFDTDVAHEQAEFDWILVDVAGMIAGFLLNSDLARVKETPENVTGVNERLKLANAQTKDLGL